MRRKVLILTNHSYMLWRFRKELIEALQKEYEVVLAMPFCGHEEEFQKRKIRCIEVFMERRGTHPFQEGKLLWCYAQLLQRERPDVVITYSIKPNLYGSFLCGRKKIPCFSNVQGLGSAFATKGLKQLVILLYRIAFGNVTKVFFENEENARAFRKWHILKEERQVVLPGAGILLEAYRPEPYPRQSVVHFLYLGRIMKEKGMDELLAAARRLKREGELFQLSIVGFCEEMYEETIRKMEQEKILQFFGFCQDPRPYYAACSCVVLPSYHEGMSNVLLEAAAMERPVIASRIPGCQESVEQNVTGFLVQAEDEEALYRAMKKMIHLSWEKRKAMGQQGRKKMEREFRKEAVVERTMEEIRRSLVRV